MKTYVEIWTVKQLFDILPNILEQPKYQRGAVWKPLKKQMLIDSMLRGIDIPKIYLRKVNRGIHQYEVADGQQRITAIKEFINGRLALTNKEINGLDLSKVGNYAIGGKKIDEINSALAKEFLKYNLTIAIVDDTSNAEVRTLFSRLQMGDTLNPAEKRNAIISSLGTEIDNIVLNHDLLTNSKISEERYKRQDYVTHVFALVHYKNKYDLKAPLLQKMYFELAKTTSSVLIKDVVKVFNWMAEIDKVSKKRIINKWGFVDIFRYLYENRGSIKSIDYSKFGRLFTEFEAKRISNSPKPENLIRGKTPTREDEALYNYIIAFQANGGNPTNLDKRLDTFVLLFKPSITFK